MERRSSGGAHVVMAEFGTQRSTCHGESPPPPQAGSLFVTDEKLANVNFECRNDAFNSIDRDVARPFFDLTDVRTMKACFVCKFFLRPAAFCADSEQIHPQQ